jgi:hypothetical protein
VSGDGEEDFEGQSLDGAERVFLCAHGWRGTWRCLGVVRWRAETKRKARRRRRSGEGAPVTALSLTVSPFYCFV